MGKRSEAGSLQSAASAIKATEKELAKLLADNRLQVEMKEEEESKMSRQPPRKMKESLSKKASIGSLATEKALEMTAKLEKAEERLREMERQVELSLSARDAALAKIQHLEDTVENLRGLVGETMRSSEQYKLKMNRAECFFDSLGGVTRNSDELIRLSEPPPSFEAYKVEHMHATELETTKARLKQSQLEVDRLRNKVESLQQQKAKVRAAKEDKLKDAEQLLASKHMQVLGAIRRVHYLLEQNERQQGELRKKDAYISKLESKLLELNRELNDARVNRRKSIEPAKAHTNTTTTTPESVRVSWQSVFEQGTLSRSPGLGSSGLSSRFSLSPQSITHTPPTRTVSPGHVQRVENPNLLVKRKITSPAKSPLSSSSSVSSTDQLEEEEEEEEEELEVEEEEEEEEEDEEGESESGSKPSTTTRRFNRLVEEELRSFASAGDDSPHEDWLAKLGASPM